MFHFELDSEGDILKFSSNSIASPEGWGNWELDILPNLRRLAVSCGVVIRLPQNSGVV